MKEFHVVKDCRIKTSLKTTTVHSNKGLTAITQRIGTLFLYVTHIPTNKDKCDYYKTRSGSTENFDAMPPCTFMPPPQKKKQKKRT
jgi:hypothetical protein